MNRLHLNTIDGDANKELSSSDQDFDEAGIEVVAEEAAEDALTSVEWEEVPQKDPHSDSVPTDSASVHPYDSTAIVAANSAVPGQNPHTAADRYPPAAEADCYRSSPSPKHPSSIVASVPPNDNYYRVQRPGYTRRSRLEFDYCRLRTESRG
jgi:hypothetical protein